MAAERQLRSDIEALLNNLIVVLDDFDGDADFEPDNDGEPDVDHEPSEDLEPSLGWPDDHGAGQQLVMPGFAVDVED